MHVIGFLAVKRQSVREHIPPPKILLQLSIAVLTGYLWCRWTFRTRYDVVHYSVHWDTANTLNASSIHSALHSDMKPILADKCKHVYLDLGTNVGIQIRKLFEPDLYPKDAGSGAMRFFEDYFGPKEKRRSSVCAFGFEPNPSHTKRLDRLEQVYSALGWRTHIFTETGVGDTEGWLVYVSDGDLKNVEWGGRLESRPGTTAATPGAIRVIDFPAFMEYIILPRRILTSTGGVRAGDGKIVMKVDIEGADKDMIAALLRSGALCHIDHVYVEHMDKATARLITIALQTTGCPTTVQYLDDEEYHNSDFPLPEIPNA